MTEWEEVASLSNGVSGRKTVVLMLVLVLIVAVYWQLVSRRTSQGAGAEVSEVTPAGLSQLLSSGKPGVLEFYTSSCPYCAKMATELARLSSSYGDKIFVVKLNAEKYVTEAVKYQVEAVPTLVYFDAAGRKLQVEAGYRDYKTLVQQLKDLGLVR